MGEHGFIALSWGLRLTQDESTLRDTANQIVRAIENLDDLNCTCIALELCARGFATFQNAFDAVRALRAIFKLAVNPLPVPSSPSIAQGMASSVRNLARQAALAAASVNAPLFMTVLSIDAIQNDADPEERATTLKLIAFMIRKKPVILFGHLPRLVDAVVKSLDPRGTLRGTLQQTATFILRYVRVLVEPAAKLIYVRWFAASLLRSTLLWPFMARHNV